MASTFSAFLCALVALALWTSIGWVFARRLSLGPALVLPLAPVLGWAVQNVVALAVSLIVGFSALTPLGTALLLGVLALLPIWRDRATTPLPEADRQSQIRPWIYLAAAMLALVPAAAVMPKIVGDGVILAAPIFDHSKVALIDEMLRGGVPPANPFFAEGGGSGSVAYYYLWHFGAAQLARLTGASGWEADIAASWFTAFASLSLMCGLAMHFCRRWLAPWLVLVFCATGSVRPVLVSLFGEERLHGVLKHGSGFAGWLFQSSWSPHHLAAACCVIVAVLLLVRLALRPTVFVTFVLALVIAAGFESSIWVGGITFALGGTAVGLVLLRAAGPNHRVAFLMAGILGVLGAAILASPLIREQMQAAVARGGGAPVIIRPVPILGADFPVTWRHILDLPAYWLVLLMIEFPLIFVPGVVTLRRLLLSRDLDRERRLTIIACAILTLACLCCSWLLLSTVGDNNDLGWRAVLPGLLVLTAAAAGGAAQWLVRPASAPVVVLLITLAVALPDAVTIVSGNIAGNTAGNATSAAADFAATPAMWAAVRKHTPTDARIANNPAFLQDILPWPVNISWALLADRRSCFAGNELAIVFAPLAPDQRTAISALFIRVFDGSGSVAAVVTAQDGAWMRDPFATSALFRLAETAAGKWRIYVATGEVPN